MTAGDSETGRSSGAVRPVTEGELQVDVLGGDPPSADEDVARLRLQLRSVPLAELEEEGLVEWDREEHVVRKGPYFEEKRPAPLFD